MALGMVNTEYHLRDAGTKFLIRRRVRDREAAVVVVPTKGWSSTSRSRCCWDPCAAVFLIAIFGFTSVPMIEVSGGRMKPTCTEVWAPKDPREEGDI